MSMLIHARIIIINRTCTQSILCSGRHGALSPNAFSTRTVLFTLYFPQLFCRLRTAHYTFTHCARQRHRRQQVGDPLVPLLCIRTYYNTHIVHTITRRTRRYYVQGDSPIVLPPTSPFVLFDNAFIQFWDFGIVMNIIYIL